MSNVSAITHRRTFEYDRNVGHYEENSHFGTHKYPKFLLRIRIFVHLTYGTFYSNQARVYRPLIRNTMLEEIAPRIALSVTATPSVLLLGFRVETSISKPH